jgi:hypothetical protein
MGCGSLLGTVAIGLVPPLSGSSYHTIFLLSMVLRLPGLLLAMRWLPGLRRVRADERQALLGSLPGVEVVSSFGRGLAGLFWRPLD